MQHLYIIERADRDRKTFIEVFPSVAERGNCLCHTYGLMTNHYHLIVETPEKICPRE